ncbi:protein-tyrosine phosphatase family protein [Actinosynnema mirum]|uniref:Swiss Army Knife protein DSP-PTPase phosphatase domain-containing protein n=1 Tax=Actinosynnema mirum (strain ATCC 29888 / DSM 43827 / JCM 3225 / NBRC 14064 / NCIMB 13271 / NRRL B-12336 / IMRU 3971 / 101) TaxID=446462 RepID=C6WGA3_ACTMD|nr:hypothetical protein Amir_6060 [Actinosynnema mirum DSM 43827]
MVVELPDGAVVTGRGLRGGPPEVEPGYGLYLGGARLRAAHDAALTWPHEWVDWPDFLLPRDGGAAARLIHDLHRRALAGEAVEVACGGGNGRTGTVLACLAVLSGVPRGEAVAWTRAHYRKHAVETPWQKRWVLRFPVSPDR